jgi:hypothetical protein
MKSQTEFFMKMKINSSSLSLPTIFVVFIFVVFNAALASEFPTEKVRLKIFDKFVSELERMDGEGLLPR